MPQVEVRFFKDEDDAAPVIDFLKECERRDRRIVVKLRERIARLRELGWELTRPEADTLRDGIHELRVAYLGVNYRLLYFFHRETNVMAILVHGCTKERAVPAKDIDLAINRMARFKAAPEKRSYRMDDEETAPE